MSEPSPVRRRIWWKLFLCFCAFSVVVLAVLGWYVTTDAFQHHVRQRVIAELEKATGGRVDVGEFHTIPLQLRFDVRNLVIHGTEPSDQTPFFRVDRLQAEIKIVSLLSTKVRLHSLALERPVAHLIVHPDGSTNAPVPPVSRTSGGPIEDLIALSISHAEAQHGELILDERRYPLDLVADDVSAALRYSFLHRHYEVDVDIGKASTRFYPHPAVDWRAKASLVLARDHADVSSLNITSGQSSFHFSGRAQDFHHLRLSGDYRGTIDLSELASFLGQPGVRKGTAQVEGKGVWTAEDFSTQGTVTAREIDWSDRRLRAQNGRLSAAFSVTPRRLYISALKANVLGGDLQGDIDVNNWQASPSAKSGNPRRVAGHVAIEGPQRGTVRLRLTGFPIAPGFAILSTKKVPLNQLNLAAAASGNLDMQWVGSVRDAEVRANLGLTPPPQTLPGQLPVQGQIAGVYRGSRDELQLDQFRINTPASEITGNGELSARSSLKFLFNSHNVNEWKPLLQAAYGSEDLPFTIHGWAKVEGTASGRLSAWAFGGNLEAYDFDTRLQVNQNSPRGTVHWDALTAAVQYSDRSLSVRNGVLIHGHAAARFDGNTALANGLFTPDSPFALNLNIRGADVAEVAQLAGLAYPVAGTADLTLRASGTRQHPHGDGGVEVREGRVYGIPLSPLRSDLRLANDEVQFNNITTRVYDAPITGNVAVNLTSHQFRSTLSGLNLNLARLPKMHGGRFAADGEADFTARASGTLEQPSVDAHVHVRDLAFDQERAGDLYIDATTHGRVMDLQAHSEFEQADLKAQGHVDLEGDFVSNLDLAFRNVDIDSLINAYLPGKTTGHSRLAGTIHLSGPLRSPRDLKLSASLNSVEAEIAHVSLHNSEPVRLEIADRILRLENMHLTGNGTDFTAHGQMQLTDAKEMDFRLNGTVGVNLLQTVNPKISARGTTTVSLNVGGTRANPVLQGRVEVKNTYLSHNDFPSGLSNLNGVLVFDQNRIQIEKLDGTTGGGTIALTGSANYQGGNLQLDIGARARNVRMRYPPGVSSTANANLRLTGSTNSALLSGQIFVTKMGVTPGFDFGAYFEKSKRQPPTAGPENLETRLKLDVHVVTTPELQMQTAIAKLSGSADLRVRGTADRPVVTGRVNANEGGQLSFNGTKYNVERFEVTFSNPAKTQPVIDIQASTRVRDYDITVNISGDVSQPNQLRPTWHSEPPLPEADVINLLALGRTREETAALSAGGTYGLGGEANLLLNEALNQAVTSRVQRLFGVSRIKIDPQGLASETNVVRGPQVTIEQQVANNLTLTYSTNVSVASQQIIQAEYNVTRNISIVALRDQNGVVSFDIKIRRRKK